METIPIRAVIANYFKTNPGKIEISFGNLNELGRGIEKIFRKAGSPIRVKNNRDEIINLVKLYSDSFELDSKAHKLKCIARNELSHLLACVPYEVKEDFMRYFPIVNSDLKK